MRSKVMSLMIWVVHRWLLENDMGAFTCHHLELRHFLNEQSLANQASVHKVFKNAEKPLNSQRFAIYSLQSYQGGLFK